MPFHINFERKDHDYYKRFDLGVIKEVYDFKKIVKHCLKVIF